MQRPRARNRVRERAGDSRYWEQGGERAGDRIGSRVERAGESMPWGGGGRAGTDPVWRLAGSQVSLPNWTGAYGRRLDGAEPWLGPLATKEELPV